MTLLIVVAITLALANFIVASQSSVRRVGLKRFWLVFVCCRRQLAQDGDLLRLSIDTRDWSLQQRHLVPGPVSTDFSVINPAFNTRPYTYIFTVYGIYTDTPQSLVKASRRRNLVFFLITRSVFKIGFYSAGRSHCRCTKVSYRMSPLPVYFYIVLSIHFPSYFRPSKCKHSK